MLTNLLGISLSPYLSGVEAVICEEKNSGRPGSGTNFDSLLPQVKTY
jgi:hypothetical protein